MRSLVFLAAAALLVVFSTAMGGLPRDTDAQDQTSAIADCAQAVGAAVQGDHCSQSSLDGTPGIGVSHTVLSGACAGADLHIVRYLPDPSVSLNPLVATYCS